MLFASLAMTLYPGTWFVSNVTFYIWIMLLILTLASIVVVPLVHKTRYPLNTKKMITIPALTYISLFFVFVIGLTSVPITINGDKAIKFTNNRQYSMNFVYYSTFDSTEDDSWSVVAFTPLAEIRFSKKINNKTFLRLPNEHNGNYLTYSSLILPKRIEGIIIEGDGDTSAYINAKGVNEVYAYGVNSMNINSNENVTVYYSGVKPECYSCHNFIKID